MTARHYASGTYKTKKPRSPCSGKGRERQAACTNTPWRESEAKAESRPAIAAERHKKKGPLEDFLKGPVNPAATYSPGPGGQVPSAI
ncbi:hypothetical protein B7982_14700, partial [Fibrobacter sp. UWB2]